MGEAESFIYYIDSFLKITPPMLEILSHLFHGKKVTGIVEKHCFPGLDGVFPATMAFVD
jgi:hypothetical protein